MPITKDPSGTLLQTPVQNDDQFEQTGTVRADSFAIRDNIDQLKQLQFKTKNQDSNSVVLLDTGTGASRNFVLPAIGGTLVTDTTAVTIGTFDSKPASADGLTANTGVIFAQSVDATHPGMVNTTTQTFSGIKTFLNGADMGSHKVTSVLDPTSAQDAATKNYVDNVASALNPKQAVYAASTTGIVGTYNNGSSGVGATFTVTATGAFSLDGSTPPVNSRILLKDQTLGLQNGVYDLTVAGTTGVSPVLTRSLDYNSPSNINSGDLIPVLNGTTNQITSWLQTSTVTTVGADSLTFTEWSYNPTKFLLKASNLSDVASKSTSFNNLSPMSALGDTIYGGASGTGTALSGNTTSTKKFLNQTGTGTVSAAPSWGTIANTDLSGITNTQLSGTAAISNANLATMSNNTVKANKSGSAAVPSDLALSSLVESTSSVLTITNGANSVVSASNLSIQVKQSTSLQSGYLSNTDWSTFNTAAGVVGDATPQDVNGTLVQRDGGGSFEITSIFAFGGLNGAAAEISLNSQAIYDGSLTPSIDWSGRSLFDASGTTAVNYNVRTLNDSGGNVTYNFDSYLLNDPTGTVSIDHSNRTLKNTSGVTIFSWDTALSANSNKISSVADPASAQDAATKNYTDTTFLKKSNNLSDVGTKSTSFNNLSPMTTLGDTIYGGASGTGTRLAGNTTSTKKFLNQTGTGTVSAAPVWGTIANTDLSGITNSQLSGSAAISNANLDTMATLTLKGNSTGSTATPSDLSVASVKTMLNLTGTNSGDITLASVGAAPAAAGASLSGQVLTLQPFDGTHPGVATASGGGTSNFLRADNTWAVPPGGGTASQVWLTGANGFGSTNTRIRRFVTTVASSGSDITYADSATLGGSFTINTAGVYHIDLMDINDTTTTAMGISINSSQLATDIQSITNANRVIQNVTHSTDVTAISVSVLCAVNDVLRCHYGQTAPNGTNNASVLWRIIGPL